MPNLTLEDDDNGVFTLSRIDGSGERGSIILSEEDVMILGQSAQKLVAQIFAKRHPGIGIVATTPVLEILLNFDISQTEIHLTMVDRHGTRVRFSLQPQIAQKLAADLQVGIAGIRKVTKQ